MVRTALAILLFGLAQTAARSDSSVPLPVAISQAQTIAIARLQTYSPDTDAKRNFAADTELAGGQSALSVLLEITRMAPMGTYQFHVTKYLAGVGPRVLHLSLPPISKTAYGQSTFPITQGRTYLLLLRKDAAGTLAPVDRNVPLIPLSDPTPALAAVQTLQDIPKLLYMSLADAAVRAPVTALLKPLDDPNLVVDLFPYIDDTDPRTRDNILYCMAVSQQVAAIPRIAVLDEVMHKSGLVADSINALSAFKTEEAVPYLNPLIVAHSYPLRFNAMLALSSLANSSSIPYLVLALWDPDPQHMIPSDAWGLMHRLVPELKDPEGGADLFYAHRQQQTDQILRWWRDELAGKHLTKGATGTTAALPVSVSGLNVLLASPYVANRQAAMSKLTKSADMSSVPYLVLALQDPNKSIAFRAITILGRLAPKLAVPGTLSDFVDSRDTYTKQIMTWWQTHLLSGERHY